MPRIFRAAAVTLLSIGFSAMIAVGVETITGEHLSRSGFVVALLIPMLIGFPVLFIIEGQKDRLRDAFAEMDRLHIIAREQIKLDSMTGLLNHQHFMEAMHEGHTSTNEGSLIVLDVDHFKKINDSWGHQKGDEALLSVVEAIREVVRESDVVGRIGGEEFAVFFPDTTGEESEIAAARIRERVEQIRFEPKKGILAAITVSIGGAFRHEVANMSIAMRLADLRMYAAKETGRNRVVFSGRHADLEE